MTYNMEKLNLRTYIPGEGIYSNKIDEKIPIQIR